MKEEDGRGGKGWGWGGGGGVPPPTGVGGQIEQKERKTEEKENRVQELCESRGGRPGLPCP